MFFFTLPVNDIVLFCILKGTFKDYSMPRGHRLSAARLSQELFILLKKDNVSGILCSQGTALGVKRFKVGICLKQSTTRRVVFIIWLHTLLLGWFPA